MSRNGLKKILLNNFKDFNKKSVKEIENRHYKIIMEENHKKYIDAIRREYEGR